MRQLDPVFLVVVVIAALLVGSLNAAPLRIALTRRTSDIQSQQRQQHQQQAANASRKDDPLVPYEDPLRLQADPFRQRRTLRATSQYPHAKTIQLKNYGNVQYIGHVAFGNPPQLLTVVFDTGSSDTWVPGTDCANCGSHNLFEYADSTTFLDTQERFIDEYGSGSVSGTVAVDTVTLAGFKVDSVKFGVVQTESEKLQAFIADGIFGLAFEGLAQISRPTVFTALAAHNPEIDNMFAFYLTPEAYKTGSELHIGGYDLSVVGPNASFHYTPVVKLPEFDSYMYWTVEMNHFSVGEGNQTTNLCAPLCYAIVDTGTSLISIPVGLYSTVLSTITQGLQCETINCEDVTLASFPVLRFGMAPDNMFLLQPRDYVVCFGWGQCQLQFQATSDAWWILGDVFIKTYYTLFDGENMRIGFACEGETCTGGRGDIYGHGNDDNDVWFRALQQAFLFGSSVAAACMFLFVFYMNQQDEGDEGDTTRSTTGSGRWLADPKTPLLAGHDSAGVEVVVARPGQMEVYDPQRGVTPPPPIVTATTSYDEARRNNASLPSPSVASTIRYS